MAKSVNTKKPSGLTITRNDNDITFRWKIADKNYGEGQQLQWRVNSKKWHSVSIGKTTTAKTVSITYSNFRPSTNVALNRIQFRVRGQRSTYTKSGTTYNPKWSDWSVKTLKTKLPRKPTATATLSDTYSNVTTFAWSTSTSVKDKRFFRNVQYQTCLVQDSGSDGSEYKYGAASTGNASGSVTYTEDTTQLAQGSYTRWYRFRARGSRGPSEWRYAHHVYASPWRAVISEATKTDVASGGYKVYVKWTAKTNFAHPIDSTTVQYAIETPDSGMVCPSGASWTDADVSRDTGGADAASFTLDQTIGLDECLYVRVNTVHDRNTTYGTAALVKDAVGYLQDPSGLSVVTDDTTYRATVTAANNSTVPDSFLAIIYRTAADPENDIIVGVIPNGGTTVTVQCPEWDDSAYIAFGVYAVAGTYTNRSQNYGTYELSTTMQSQNTLWDGGTVPTAPDNLSVVTTDRAGVVKVAWDWTWTDADIAVISWSDDPLAWESTTEPTTYEIKSIHAAQWYIAGLETGMTWYVRVKLAQTSGDSRTEGPWSEIVSIDLSSAPSIPVLALSEAVIPEDGTVTASWAYVSTDGTNQAYAEITTAVTNASGVYYGEYTLSADNTVDADKDYFVEASGIYTLQVPGGSEDPQALGWYEVTPNIIAHTETAQHIDINAEDMGWTAGATYNLCVRVVSASGKTSDAWSDPVAVTVAAPPTAVISSTSLSNVTVSSTDENGNAVTETFTSLTALPLSVTITGAGDSGTTILAIERAADYHMDRPDETDFNGYEGETVALISQLGESQIDVDVTDLIGSLDDGAAYRIVATVKDDFGQSDEATLDFEVHWSHQAVEPTATVTIDTSENIAKITPVLPVGALNTDVCDIYRLSADRPQLVVKDGTFGTTYVDPYPTIGEYGGHRVVLKTADGDYITSSNQPAWVDLGEADGDILDLQSSLIDFDGYQLECLFNMSISHSFEKDFQETTYLGGAVQGDWNKAVKRSGTVDAVFVLSEDPDTLRKLRALAAWPGICHVRTREGSSYAADVQVGDDISYDTAGKILNATLTITRVDSEGYDGMSLTEWEEGTS